MAQTFSQFDLTLVLSGIVLLGAYLAILTVYRSIRNREQKRRHKLPFDK